MSTFITQLRNAHLVYTAYHHGAKSIPELTNATHLSIKDVVAWAEALRLQLVYRSKERYQLPFAANASFSTFNNEGV